MNRRAGILWLPVILSLLMSGAFATHAEALYKLGVVSAGLENKKAAAREYWERATAADPACRYGAMAQEKLKVVPAK